MKTSLKKIGIPVLIALAILSTSAISRNLKLDHYDTAKGFLWWETWPPYIPGTEKQNEVKIQVLDATTMLPIAGALVVAGYYGDVCEHSESAVSDAQGWATLPNDQDPRVREDSSGAALHGPVLESAYKRGYQMVSPAPRSAIAGGDNEWYVREMKPSPRAYNVTRQILSSRKFSSDHKSALMETKERRRIYLMPSTAFTREERARELRWMTSENCEFTLPFEFSASEGVLASWKALYQEKLDIGFTKRSLAYDKDLLDRAEKGYLEFRQRISKKKPR
jgi:hypothetical protein